MELLHALFTQKKYESEQMELSDKVLMTYKILK